MAVPSPRSLRPRHVAKPTTLRRLVRSRTWMDVGYNANIHVQLVGCVTQGPVSKTATEARLGRLAFMARQVA